MLSRRSREGKFHWNRHFGRRARELDGPFDRRFGLGSPEGPQYILDVQRAGGLMSQPQHNAVECPAGPVQFALRRGRLPNDIPDGARRMQKSVFMIVTR